MAHGVASSGSASSNIRENSGKGLKSRAAVREFGNECAAHGSETAACAARRGRGDQLWCGLASSVAHSDSSFSRIAGNSGNRLNSRPRCVNSVTSALRQGVWTEQRAGRRGPGGRRGEWRRSGVAETVAPSCSSFSKISGNSGKGPSTDRNVHRFNLGKSMTGIRFGTSNPLSRGM
jgi:hypothetical protein